MAEREPLGLTGVEGIHYYVRDLERMRRFLVNQLDFTETGGSSSQTTENGGQTTAVFQAGGVRFVVSQPLREGSRAWRWLKRHPEGVGTIVFSVADADHTFKLLDQRGGTFINAVERWDTPDGGALRTFNITTPFGDTTFRFIERRDTAWMYPGFQPHEAPRGGSNRFGFTHIDHITSNFQTMEPMLLWLEHVMGFQRFWDVEFHTTDLAKDADHGSGLKSVVMYEPQSGAKFANNEPARPFFTKSQINLFGNDHRGDGVQHTALALPDIISGVRDLRTRGVEFMPTPGTYYDMLPERLVRLGVNAIDEDHDILRELQILVDGDRNRSYLLQIFLKEQAGLFKDTDAGPFFIELIQRKGDQGFGAGNFRALFESIERAQQADGRI
jgi:4-hydroxyphenylpyruvate dioxygenase